MMKFNLRINTHTYVLFECSIAKMLDIHSVASVACSGPSHTVIQFNSIDNSLNLPKFGVLPHVC